jgi:hypothetical protein
MKIAAAKWAALIDDRVVWSPGRQVLVKVLKAQGQVDENRVLVQDHNLPDDVVLQDDVTIDLASGNVFYTAAAGELKPGGTSSSTPKLAFFVDDRPVVTTRMDQTGKSLRELFNIPPHTKLVRDRESDKDDPIGPEDKISFIDGPVFYARPGEPASTKQAQLSITVNARRFTERDGVKSEMTGLQIAALVYPEDPKGASVLFVSEGGREVPLAQQLQIRGGEVFDASHLTSSSAIGSF